MPKQIDLVILIPAYNEGDRLGKSLDELSLFLTENKFQDKVAVVPVIDKSGDDTLEVAKSKKNKFMYYNVLQPKQRLGKGGAVKFGMLHTQGRYQLFMDADLATPLHHLNTIFKYMAENKDVIIGIRNLTSTHKGLRKFISSFGNLLVRFVLGLSLPDTQCGFKAFKEVVAEDLFERQTITGWGFDMEVLAIAKSRGYTIQAIEISDWRDVAGGAFVNVAATGALSTFRDLLVIKKNLIIGRYNRHGKDSKTDTPQSK